MLRHNVANCSTKYTIELEGRDGNLSPATATVRIYLESMGGVGLCDFKFSGELHYHDYVLQSLTARN